MASNSVDLHLNIQDSLSKTVDKGTKSASGFNDKMQEANNTASKLKEKMGGVTETLSGAKQQMSRFGNTLQRVLPAFGIIFGGGFIADSVKELFDMNQAMADTAYQMGHGAEGAKQLENAVFGVMQTTGIANEEAQKFVKSLTELRVPLQHLESMAVAASDFSEMTGVSADATSRLAGEMMRVGSVSANATKEVMANMAIVQRASGMSAGEMQNLGESMQETTRLLSQMGKEGAEITSFNKGVSQLAGAFASAGVEAKKATEFIDEMLDPSKVEENAYLYSQLGVSMQEAFSGDVSPEKLIPKFQQLGEKMQNMSGPAAAAMAENLGMSARTLRQFAEIDTSKQQKMMKMMNEEGMSAQKALRQLNEEQDKGTRNFSEAINKLKGNLQPLIGSFLNPMVNTIAKLADSGKLQNMFKEAGDKVTTFVSKIRSFVESGKLTETFQKVKDVISGIMDKFKPAFFIAIGATIFLIVRKLKRRFFSMATETGEKMNEAFGSSITGAAKKSSEKMKTQFNKKISDIGEKLKGTFSSPSMVEKTEKTYANIEKQLEATDTLRRENEAAYGTQLSQLNAEKTSLRTRIDYLKSVNRTTAEQTELNRELKREQQIEKDIGKAERRRNKDQRRYYKYEEKQMKDLSDEQLRSRKREVQQQRSAEEEAIKAGQRREEELRDLDKNLNFRKEMLEEQKQSGTATTAELKELSEVNSWLDQNEKELGQINDERAESYERLDDLENKENQLNQTYERRYKAKAKDRRLDTETGADAMKGFQGIIVKGMDRLKSVGSNVRAMGRKAMQSAGDKIIRAGRFLQDEVFSRRALKRNLGRVMKSSMKAAGSGLKGGMKGLGKIMGKMMIPMMIMSTAMELLQPVIEGLKPVFNELKDAFQDLLSKAMPGILKFFGALMPILAPLINMLLPAILGAMGLLLKGISELAKFMMELPERFIFHLPKALGGKGGSRDDLSEKQEEELKELKKQRNMLEMKKRGPMGVRQPLSDEEKKKLQGIKSEIGKLGGTYKASEKLKDNSIYSAMEDVSSASSDMLEQSKEDFKKALKGEGPVQGEELKETFTNLAEEVKNKGLGGMKEEEDGTAGGMAPGTKKTTTTWTPAMLEAGREGISVKEKAKQTTVEKTEAEANKETADNTGKIAETLEALRNMEEEKRKEVINEFRKGRGNKAAKESSGDAGAYYAAR